MNFNLGKRLRDRKELLGVFAELGYKERPGLGVIGELIEFTRDASNGAKPFCGALASFEARWSLVDGKRVLKNISFYFSPISRVSERELLTIDLALPSFQAVAFEAGSKEAFPIMGKIKFVPTPGDDRAEKGILQRLVHRLGDIIHSSARLAAAQRDEKLRLTRMEPSRAIPPSLGPEQARRVSNALRQHLGVLGRDGQTVDEHILRIVGIPMAFEYTLGEGTELAEEAIFHGVIDALFPKWELKDGEFELSELSFSFLIGSRLARFDLLLIDFRIVKEGIYSEALVLADEREVSLRGHLYCVA